jgi:tetratricopeptide (TPR) repeat protein
MVTGNSLLKNNVKSFDDKSVSPGHSPAELFHEGLTHLRDHRPKEAMLAFRHSLQLKPGVPLAMSYYGLCWAMCMNKSEEALLLCRTAVEKDFINPELFWNLGRVYLLRKDSEKAYMTFQKGLAVDKRNKNILNELKKMGIRKSPIIPFLNRTNIINNLLGKILKKSGME